MEEKEKVIRWRLLSEGEFLYSMNPDKTIQCIQDDGVTIHYPVPVKTSLGALGDKRSFVSLMRVIKSNYPTGLKKEAQASFESIKWN